jgi:hypothetical protein
MNPPIRLYSAFPGIAARIDTERVIIARAIAEHVTVSWDDHEITFSCEDAPTLELLQNPSQLHYLNEVTQEHGFQTLIIEPGFVVPDREDRAAAPDNPPPPVNTVPPVNEVTLVGPVTPKQSRQMLNISQRSKLLTWLETNRALAELEPDTDLAVTASEALGFPLNASHIRTLRTHLGIAKVKPEPLPADLSLADLQARLAAHEERLDNHAVQAAGMKATIAALHDRLRVVIARVNEGAVLLAVADLPPLNQSGQ